MEKISQRLIGTIRRMALHPGLIALTALLLMATVPLMAAVRLEEGNILVLPKEGVVPATQPVLRAGMPLIVAGPPPSHVELNKSENFWNKTDVLEYKLSLDSSIKLVNLKVSAKISHGRVRWELLDPEGAVRLKVSTTEEGSSDTEDLKSVQGEWVLRIRLEAASGICQIQWKPR